MATCNMSTCFRSFLRPNNKKILRLKCVCSDKGPNPSRRRGKRPLFKVQLLTRPPCMSGSQSGRRLPVWETMIIWIFGSAGGSNPSTSKCHVLFFRLCFQRPLCSRTYASAAQCLSKQTLMITVEARRARVNTGSTLTRPNGRAAI